MTIEQIVCVMFGSILQAIVFVLGVAVAGGCPLDWPTAPPVVVTR